LSRSVILLYPQKKNTNKITLLFLFKCSDVGDETNQTTTDGSNAREKVSELHGESSSSFTSGTEELPTASYLNQKGKRQNKN